MAVLLVPGGLASGELEVSLPLRRHSELRPGFLWTLFGALFLNLRPSHGIGSCLPLGSSISPPLVSWIWVAALVGWLGACFVSERPGLLHRPANARPTPICTYPRSRIPSFGLAPLGASGLLALPCSARPFQLPGILLFGQLLCLAACRTYPRESLSALCAITTIRVGRLPFATACQPALPFGDMVQTPASFGASLSGPPTGVPVARVSGESTFVGSVLPGGSARALSRAFPLEMPGPSVSAERPTIAYGAGPPPRNLPSIGLARTSLGPWLLKSP